MITKPEDICLEIESSLAELNLFSKEAQDEKGVPHWRVSPEPYYLSSEEILFFEVPSSTDYSPHHFSPNYFVEISKYWEIKKKSITSIW